MRRKRYLSKTTKFKFYRIDRALRKLMVDFAETETVNRLDLLRRQIKEVLADEERRLL